MGVGAGLYMYVVVVQKFTFAISSPDEFLLFVYWNISGTAERICAKFIRKTCFIPCLDKFEGLGQRSKVKVSMDKDGIFGPIGGLRASYVW